MQDWIDSYLDALSTPGQTVYFPPDAAHNHKGLKQRLMFDAAANSELEYRLLLEAEERLTEQFGGFSGNAVGGTTPTDAAYKIGRAHV